MDGDSSARILVVGADPAAKRDVIAKLHALSGQKFVATDSPQQQPLTLATKYYTASVDVHVHQVLENEPVTALAHELHEYEAVVCVVDVAREESFLHVSRFLARLADEQIDVCLLVGCNSQSEKTSAVAQHIERVQTWCLDNEFEFVELCDDAAVAIAGGNQDESEFGANNEKLGMDRVLEALHCNMWSSMVMKSAEAQKPHEEDNGLRELSNVSVALSTPSADDKKIEASASVGSSNQEKHEPADAGEGDDDRLQTLLRALEITEAADAPSTGAALSADNQDDGEDDDDDDIDMAEFSALISEVRRVRDDGQTLTDEQRRQRAAEVAMKLWSFLGADDESEAEEDAEEEEGAGDGAQ